VTNAGTLGLAVGTDTKMAISLLVNTDKKNAILESVNTDNKSRVFLSVFTDSICMILVISLVRYPWIGGNVCVVAD